MIKLLDILNEAIEEEKKKADRCLRIARRKYDKPSAYRSGAIVKCRQGKIWKGLKEEIAAAEAHEDESAVQTVIDGKRNLGAIAITSSTMSPDLFWKLVKDHNLKTLKVPSNPYNLHIYYREGAEKEAKELRDIAEKYGGFFAYNATEEDSRRIGQLLGYRKEDIDSYIERTLQKKGLEENNQEDSVKYIKPDFEFEWEEATRYPEFIEIGKDNWIKLGNRGHAVNYSDIERRLGNVDLDFGSLDIDKQARFKKAFRSGIIEYPIAVKFNDNDYDLVAGNTRLAGLVEFGVDPKIWVVDLTQLNEAKKESLHKWFSRQGGSGSSKGWVDCNTCRDGKCKPCGRQKGEKRAKYPSCRPTPAACKQKGKGKTWGKTK